MKFSIVDLLTLLGALGFFIYGMKVMSEGIQKVAGDRLREILSAMTSNRFAGVFTGFLLTTLVQSSSATTVMVVSFVNAGLLSLIQSIGVIMGANIGTTVTAWIISIVGFKVKIATASLPIIAFGFPLLFSSKAKWRAWGEFLVGFALLFMGLDELKNSVPDIKSNPEILEFLTNYTGLGIISTLLFVLVGTLLTVVIQSSSATMALTLVMANQGWIGFDTAAAMVLGENIGTTVTANVAALVANQNAKRAARAHFIFNIFGVIWMILLFSVFISGINYFMESRYGMSPFSQPEAIPIALSIFHSTFNVINVALLVGFTGFIARIVIRMVPKEEEEDIFRLDYLNTERLKTPEIFIREAQKEIAKFYKQVSMLPKLTLKLIEKRQLKGRNKIMSKIKDHEEITDRAEAEISEFLIKVLQNDLSRDASLRIRSMIGLNNLLERIGDRFYELSLEINKIFESGKWFTQEQQTGISSLLNLLDDYFAITLKNLENDYSEVSLEEAQLQHQSIRKQEKQLVREHLKSIKRADYGLKKGISYNNLISLCRILSDHLLDVNRFAYGDIIVEDDEDLTTKSAETNS